MALVLAIDPAFTHHDALQRLADDLAAHEIVFASSCDEALAIISRQIPDLVVFPVFCSDADEARIAARVGALSHADDPRTLAIPLLASTVAETPATPARWFYWFKPRDETTGEPRDPGAFADEIRDYLEAGPGDLSTGLFREFSAEAGDSLAERVVRRLHERSWRGSLGSDPSISSSGASECPYRRGCGRSGQRCCWPWRQCRPWHERASRGLRDPRANTPSSRARECHRRPWLQSAGAALLLAVTASARASLARLSGLRLEYPSRPAPARTVPEMAAVGRRGAAPGVSRDDRHWLDPARGVVHGEAGKRPVEPLEGSRRGPAPEYRFLERR